MQGRARRQPVALHRLHPGDFLDRSGWPMVTSGRHGIRGISRAVRCGHVPLPGLRPAPAAYPAKWRGRVAPALGALQRGARAHAVLERGIAQGLSSRAARRCARITATPRTCGPARTPRQPGEAEGAHGARREPRREPVPSREPGGRRGRRHAGARVRLARRRERLLLVQGRAGLPDALRPARRIRGAGRG